MISEMVSVPADRVTLGGDLVVPARARAIVLIAHGIDSPRHSPGSRTVTAALHRAGFGTLSLDLLSEAEDRGVTPEGDRRFDVRLLGRRAAAGTDWLKAQPETRTLPIALFGSGVESAAVLEAAAELPDRALTAVVWGARPDLAGDALGRIRVPVLFVEGDRDPGLLRLDQQAADRIPAANAVRVVRDAGPLFQEPGALDEVVALATAWCDEQLRGGTDTGR
ncbi:hydrolase [Streptomyces sp. DH24]|uniref:dienelactone hydrolase family protein n=1 Tax=Streptomyces sp. DH24 TaxID=3040123 RepID=UPI002442DD1C|nr:hydrolase [Streptomyces sp. DH24]MDG9718362.1 hydrolase [Streptomyces sp. DH24]